MAELCKLGASVIGTSRVHFHDPSFEGLVKLLGLLELDPMAGVKVHDSQVLRHLRQFHLPTLCEADIVFESGSEKRRLGDGIVFLGNVCVACQ